MFGVNSSNEESKLHVSTSIETIKMNEQELERIANLPDGMPSEELEEEFQKLLMNTQPIDQEQDIWLLEAYLELSDRQWHNYKSLSSSLLNSIDSTLISLWDKHSLGSTELLLGVTARLGLVKTFVSLKSALDGELSTIVRQEILEAVDEFGATVDNAYSGLHERNR